MAPHHNVCVAWYNGSLYISVAEAFSSEEDHISWFVFLQVDHGCIYKRGSLLLLYLQNKT